MKFLTIAAMATFVFACDIICVADEPASFTTKQTFTGVVAPLLEQDILFGYNDEYRGWVNYTARPGQLFFGEVYDTNGKLIREGTLLLQLNTEYRKAKLDFAKAKYRQDLASLKLARLNYDRYTKLVKTHSVSEADYESMRSAYESAMATAEASKASVQLAQSTLDFCTYRAKYDGIVEQVYFPFGWLAAELKVMKIAPISPIGVRITMDRALTYKISRNTPITIYPADSDKGFGAYHGMMISTDDGILLTVDNYLREPKTVEIEGKKIPIIDNLSAVRNYRPEGRASVDDPPVIYVLCILQDEKGSYVWKIDNEKANEPGRGTDYIVTVRKIYIPFKKMSSGNIHSLTSVVLDPKLGISYGDMLITKESVPAGMKDGDKVLISSNRYIFMPGDKVKVEIGPNPGKIK